MELTHSCIRCSPQAGLPAPGWCGIKTTPRGWVSERGVEQQAVLEAAAASLKCSSVPVPESEVKEPISTFLKSVQCEATAAVLADCLEAFVNHYRPFQFNTRRTNFASGKLLKVRQMPAQLEVRQQFS
jgi:hypothetical protein